MYQADMLQVLQDSYSGGHNGVNGTLTIIRKRSYKLSPWSRRVVQEMKFIYTKQDLLSSLADAYMNSLSRKLYTQLENTMNC